MGVPDLWSSTAPQPLLTATDAKTLIQWAYDRVVAYGDGEIPGLRFKISNVRILNPKDFATFPVLEEASQASGYLIRAIPTTFTYTPSGAQGAHLQMRWDLATPQEEQEAQAATRDLAGWSIARIEVLAAITDPKFFHVDRIVLYHVQASSRAMARDYDAAFVWATGVDGQQLIYPQDEITGGVGWAVVQVLPPVRNLKELEERTRDLRGTTSTPRGEKP